MLNPIAVFSVLGSKVRWPLIQLMADGRELNVEDGAKAAGVSPVNFSKHLRIMVDAGVMEWHEGRDRRMRMFSIPAAYRRTPGVLDFGCCQVTVRAS